MASRDSAPANGGDGIHAHSGSAGPAALPSTASVPLVRTDFSDDAGWNAVRDRAVAPRRFDDGSVFSADVEPVDDPAFAGLSPARLLDLVPDDAPWSLVLVADAETTRHADHHVLVIEVPFDGREADENVTGPRTFRAVPEAVQEVENNLSLANMDWDEFLDAADADGIVRPVLTALDDA